MRTNLRIRRSGSPAAFDNEVCDFLKQPRWNNTNRATPGEWLRNLVAFSLANCTGFGATTLAIGVVVGEKLAYYSAGDAILMVFRKNNTTKGWVTVVETREQRIVIRTSDGSMQKCPVQLKVYQPDQQNGRHGMHKVKANQKEKQDSATSRSRLWPRAVPRQERKDRWR